MTSGSNSDQTQKWSKSYLLTVIWTSTLVDVWFYWASISLSVSNYHNNSEQPDLTNWPANTALIVSCCCLLVLSSSWHSGWNSRSVSGEGSPPLTCEQHPDWFLATRASIREGQLEKTQMCRPSKTILNDYQVTLITMMLWWRNNQINSHSPSMRQTLKHFELSVEQLDLVQTTGT